MEGVASNCTAVLNIAFLLLAAALLVRFLRTDGPAMLRMMGGPPKRDHGGHDHGGHNHGCHGHRAHH